MNVTVSRFAGADYQNIVMVELPREQFSLEMNEVQWYASPSMVLVDLDKWNGEHFSFDADDFSFNEESGLEECEGPLGERLQTIWLHQWRLYFLMYPFKSKEDETEWSFKVLAPMEYMLGMKVGETHDWLEESERDLDMDGAISDAILQNAF